VTTSSGTDPRILCDTVLRLLHRDLAAVQRELLAYPDDESPWQVVPGIANSGGTLALHLAGNLRHFVGATLGGTGYRRDRDAEFNERSLTRDALSAQLGDAMAQTAATLRALDANRLGDDFPVVMGNGVTLRIDVMLVHLVAHTSYHLGQIDYHRRMTTGDSATVGALPLPALVGPLPELPQPPADARA
jgi:uncharacterized damage-inducible protein DinB